MICYFFPFTFFLVTCNSNRLLNIGIAYNQTEANRNILVERETCELILDSTNITQQNLADSIKKVTLNPKALKDSVIKSSNIFATPASEYFVIITRKIIFPTDSSLSGIGSIFYFKNLIGQVAIALSLIISLILFVMFKFLKSQRIKKYLLLTAILCLTIFVIDSFVSSVTLLWGSWTLFLLFLTQLILEFTSKTKAYC